MSRNELLMPAFAAAAFFVLLSFSPVGQAQKPEHPVLEGIWRPMGMGMGMGTGTGPRFSIGGLRDVEPPVFTAEGQAWVDAFDFPDDETIRCVEDGVIRQLIHPYPQETWQGLDTFLIRYEAWEAVRVVYLDGRGHPEGEPNSLMGHSIGHYEGDSLVVETAGLAGKVNNIPMFHMLSDQHTVTERYTRSDDGSTLTIDVVVTDPATLAEPWHFTKVQTFYEDYDLLEYKCIDRPRLQ